MIAAVAKLPISYKMRFPRCHGVSPSAARMEVARNVLLSHIRSDDNKPATATHSMVPDAMTATTVSDSLGAITDLRSAASVWTRSTVAPSQILADSAAVVSLNRS